MIGPCVHAAAETGFPHGRESGGWFDGDYKGDGGRGGGRWEEDRGEGGGGGFIEEEG